MIQRRKTRQIQLGKVKVGGDAPITVQSMTKTDTRDVRATVQQIWSWKRPAATSCAAPCRCAKRRSNWARSRNRSAFPGRRHSFQLQTCTDRHRARRRWPAAQSRQHRRAQVRRRSRQSRLGAKNSDSHRRQRRFLGKRSAAKIQRPDGCGDGRERAAPYSYTRRCQLSRDQDFAEGFRSFDDDRSLPHARR